jgi:phosphate transport system permease protein
MNNELDSPGGEERRRTIDVVNASLARRYASERRFRLVGRLAVLLGLAFVAVLFVSIFANGYSGFLQSYLRLHVTFDPAILDPDGKRDLATIRGADYGALVKQALRAEFPEVTGRAELRELYKLASVGAEYRLMELVAKEPALIGTSKDLWLLASDKVDLVRKGQIDRSLPESERPVNDRLIGWLDALEKKGVVDTRVNWSFFTTGDSRDPELAGIGGAIAGSFYTLLVCLALSFPIGVAAAVYLEEFAAKSRWTDLIEVNINNLAAVPSIVFGLLGLAVLINFFGLPRSAPVVGGLVLTLMTLPTIIIAGRAALKSVPPSIREAALGVGASKMQTVFHHVLPLAMPGMLTGTIIGMARALGESAPLLMIGMVAFIVDVPKGFFEPSTVLPVQIYLWADSPERAFVAKTAAATIVLLGFLITMNALAVFLRKRFERRW